MDLLQYFSRAIVWSFFAHSEEKKGKKDTDEVSPDDTINHAPLIFFYLKTVVCVVAYLLLALYLSKKW